MGAEQSSEGGADEQDKEAAPSSDTAAQNMAASVEIVAAPAATPEAAPSSAQQFTVKLKDMAGDEVRQAIGTGGGPDGAASTARSVQMSYRMSKAKKSTKVGLTVESKNDGSNVVKILEIKKGSLFASLGAQKGDILVSVNGVACTGSAQATGLIKKSVGDVELIIEREEVVDANGLDSIAE